MKYAFIDSHKAEFRILTMCRVLGVHRSGFYAWRRQPHSARSLEDERLSERVEATFEASGGAYGSPRIGIALRRDGLRISDHRVARLMKIKRLRATLPKRKPPYAAGHPSRLAPNRLRQVFTATEQDQVWVTDVTYLRTLEGWLYLSVVVDLYSRLIVGWAMRSMKTTDLAISALSMAVHRRKPPPGLILHSDQGSECSSYDFIDFLDDHGIIHSMSRRGNCFDNAVAESFFASLKKERVKGRTYRSRAEARADIFDYIELFYNRLRQHRTLGSLSPMEFERVESVQ